MRVIAGKARSMPLKTVQGLNTRPTTDRIKETLFNMIQNEVYGCRFLDLFSGSGGIGIEALSRGASEAVFVEQNRQALDCIRANLAFTGLSENSRVITGDVLSALARMDGEPPFQIIFMDPPYDHQWEKRVLEVLADSTLIDEETLIIVEASLKTDFSYVEDLGYRVRKRKEYKTNMHLFLETGEYKNEKGSVSGQL